MVVVPGNARESDLIDCVEGRLGEWGETSGAQIPGYWNMAWLCALMALLLLGLQIKLLAGMSAGSPSTGAIS